MKLHSIFVAVLAVVGAASANALVTSNMGAYTLSYDELTPGFGGVAYTFNGGGGSTGFGWNVDPSVLVASTGAPAAASFALPDFTITVNPGWALSGAVTGFLGNLVYNEYGAATTSATASGTVSVDAGPGVLIGGALTKTVNFAVPGLLSVGYYAGDTSVPVGAFSSFSFTGGMLALTAAGGSSAVVTQPQNTLRFGLIATPVPEPETAALMLAGLLTLVSLASRRGRG